MGGRGILSLSPTIPIVDRESHSITSGRSVLPALPSPPSTSWRLLARLVLMVGMVEYLQKAKVACERRRRHTLLNPCIGVIGLAEVAFRYILVGIPVPHTSGPSKENVNGSYLIVTKSSKAAQ